MHVLIIRIALTTLCAATVTLGIVGCKKKNGSTEPAADVCVIDTIWRVGPLSSSRNVFSYDDNGRVVSRVTTTSAGDVFTAAISYASDGFVVRGTSSASSSLTRDSFVLNRSGYISYVRHLGVEERDEWYAYNYFYDTENRLQKVEVTDNTSPSLPLRTDTYRWDGGSLATVSRPMSADVTFEYYVGRRYQLGDALDWEYKSFFSFPRLNNGYLVKGYLFGGVPMMEYSYEFDDAGRIHSVMATRLPDSTNPTYTFTVKDTYNYRCQ